MDAPHSMSVSQIEMEIRYQQLREIRAMLKLPQDATHQEVVNKLAAIGQFDTRIDMSAVPERYKLTKGDRE